MVERLERGLLARARERRKGFPIAPSFPAERSVPKSWTERHPGDRKARPPLGSPDFSSI